MNQRIFLELENKNTPIVIYNRYTSNLHKNIEEVIKKIGGTELGSVKTKHYEEYFYHKAGDDWEVYVNIALPPLKYDLT